MHFGKKIENALNSFENISSAMIFQIDLYIAHMKLWYKFYKNSGKRAQKM